jgi:hypothetical protein
MRMTREERDNKYRNLHRHGLEWVEQFVRDLLHDADVADSLLSRLEAELKFRREWMDKVIQLQADALLLENPKRIVVPKENVDAKSVDGQKQDRNVPAVQPPEVP